jgi:imidazole glycerol-phosphate synthase subunit HisF
VLKKRLVGVVIVKNGWAIQSIGYKRYLPLGKPECIVENLDRWGADEIIILSIDRTKNALGPDFSLIKKLSSLCLETPLIYGGGIASIDDGLKVIKLGADRICVDSLLHNSHHVLKKLSQNLGQQAIIGVMPVSCDNNLIEWLDYRNNTSLRLKEYHLNELSQLISELMIIDWANEGYPSSFNMDIISCFYPTTIPLIPFGGLNEVNKIDKLLADKKISAVALGNFLNYKEHSLQRYKKELNKTYIRTPYYVEKSYY